tara:strand:+ start:607 stop:828 length:222 start_codon:yes stop_codon:yes gene_type:complete
MKLVNYKNRNIKLGDKVKVVTDIPSVNGMLHKNTIVKIDEITNSNPVRGSIRVVDNLGKIWWLNSKDISVIDE